MIKTKTTTINGREWSVTQWSGTKNLDVIYLISTVLGPTLAKGITGGGAQVLGADFDLGKAIEGLLAGLGSKENVRSTIFQLLSGTRIDGVEIGNPAAFDAAFSGTEIFDLPLGLRFVLETNFGDFTRAAGGIIARFAATQEVPEAPPVSQTA